MKNILNESNQVLRIECGLCIFSATKLNLFEANFQTGVGWYRANVSFHNLVFVSICAHTPIKVHELLDLKLFQYCLFY